MVVSKYIWRRDQIWKFNELPNMEAFPNLEVMIKYIIFLIKKSNNLTFVFKSVGRPFDSINLLTTDRL